MDKEIKEKCKECVYYNERMEYPKINGTTTHSNCISIKCDYRKATKDLKIIRLKNKVAELEGKLAESEKLKDDAMYNLALLNQDLSDTKEKLSIERRAYNILHGNYSTLISSYYQLKQQLVELKQDYDNLFDSYVDAKKQLNEKEREETKRMQDFEKECQEYYKSNQTAIAELEKVRTCFGDYLKGLFWNDTMLVGKVCNMINEIVDQQIKSLKGKK